MSGDRIFVLWFHDKKCALPPLSPMQYTHLSETAGIHGCGLVPSMARIGVTGTGRRVMKGRSLLGFGVSFAVLSLFSGSFVYLSKPATADEVYLDNKCRRNQALQQDDRFTVFYSSEFTANGQKYWLYAGRYQDGAVIFCISRPNFREARTLSASQIQNQFIDKIVKDPNRNATFIVTVAEGNNFPVPLTDYRLDLNNPNRPVLTRLRRRLGRT